MRLGTRMIIIALAAAAGALLVVLFVAGPRLRAQVLQTARTTLFAEARGQGTRFILGVPARPDPESLPT